MKSERHRITKYFQPLSAAGIQIVKSEVESDLEQGPDTDTEFIKFAIVPE